MNILKIFITVFYVVSLTACNQTKAPTQNNSEKPAIPLTMVKGKVTSAGIFSYYLPKSYSTTQKLPIIFIFDPHGDGNFPLNKYFPFAEQYSFILVASNVSKNGLQQNQLEGIIKQFFSKVSESITYASNRIYVMGFSGGARVASIAVVEQPGVKGMILCGGGLAFDRLPQGMHPSVLSFAGREDFNMVELMNLDTLLTETNLRNQLLIFNGHHQWPDSLSMEDAFFWTLFNEMKDSIIPVNDTLIDRFLTLNNQKLKIEKNVFLKYLLLRKIVAFADGLTDVEKQRLQLKTIEHSRLYKQYLKNFLQTISKEQQQEQSLVQAMGSQSFEWWKHTIAKLSQDTGKATIAAKSHLRILNYLSLAAYMQCDHTLKSNQDNIAGTFIGLYQLIDPKNSEGYYMEAQLAMRKNNIPATIIALKKAVDLGFDDFNRMQNEQDFARLYNNPDFMKLLDKIRH